MHKFFLVIGGLLAFIGVAAGAFGAHALKQKLPVEMLNAFEVGVRYQMYHALALLVVGLLHSSLSHSLVGAAGWTFVAGTFVFSGSLYILSISGVRAWGAVTPIGGVLLLAGWLLFILGIIKS